MTAIQRPQLRLHYGRGVRGYRGLGQPDPTAVDTTTYTNPVYTGQTSDIGLTVIDPNTGQQVPAADVGQGYPSTVTPAAGSGGAVTTTTQGGFNLTSFLNNLITTAGKATTTALSPYSALSPGTTLYSTPSGTLVSTAGSAGANVLSSLNLSSTLSSLLPILLIGGAVILVFSLVEKK